MSKKKVALTIFDDAKTKTSTCPLDFLICARTRIYSKT